MKRYLEEFAVSLLRVAAHIKRRDIRTSLERLSLELVEYVNKSEFVEATRVLKAIESVIHIGSHIAEIEPVNASIIVEKMSLLNKQILGLAGLHEFGNWSNIKVADSAEAGETSNEKEENGNSATRQSAIIGKIRQYQSGGGRATLKEIMATLPAVSERTVRYDLQKLCAKGVVERVGQGGPSTHYVIK